MIYMLDHRCIETDGRQNPLRNLIPGSPGKIVRELRDEAVAEITGFSGRSTGSP